MSAVINNPVITKKYLQDEINSEVKHELIAGCVYAMAGASKNHERISGNLYAEFSHHLKSSPCEPFASDIKVKAGENFFYPDVMVSCDETDHKAEQFLSNPSIIIEVLSDSTEAFDRSEKFAAYRHLQSLKEYILIDIKARRIECFRRTKENDWLLHVSENQENCDFICLNISAALDDIFEDVENN